MAAKRSRINTGAHEQSIGGAAATAAGEPVETTTAVGTTTSAQTDLTAAVNAMWIFSGIILLILDCTPFVALLAMDGFLFIAFFHVFNSLRINRS